MFMLIGLAGPAGAGKTTAANLLGAELGYEVLGFADPIRDTVLRLVPAWTNWQLAPGKDVVDTWLQRSPRDMMRIVGDHARSLQWDIYIREAARRIAAHRDHGAAGVVIHDLRTQLEAEWLRLEGGKLIYLQREGVAFRGDHDTEMGVSAQPGDLVVRNPGTIDGLRGELLGALVDIRRKAAA